MVKYFCIILLTFFNANFLSISTFLVLLLKSLGWLKISADAYGFFTAFVLTLIFIAHILIDKNLLIPIDLNLVFIEMKLVFFIVLFSLFNSNKVKRFLLLDREVLINFFIIASYLTVAIIYILHGHWYLNRFMDLIYIFNISSVYYGIIIAYFAYYCSPKQIPYLLVLGIINTSGTGLIGLTLVLVNRYWRGSNLPWLFLLVCAIFALLYYSQIDRGRNLFDIDSIDRVLVLKAYLNYVYEVFTFDMILFGAGPLYNLEDFTLTIENANLKNYLISESSILVSKMLHNDFLRIFNTFGLIGLSLTVVFIKKNVIQETPLFLIFMIMSFASSIWYVSSIMILIFFYSMSHTSIKKR